MRTFKLEMRSTNGEIISEEDVVLGEGDTLIINVPDHTTDEEIEEITRNIRSMMENDGINALIIPESVKLSVLKIN